MTTRRGSNSAEESRGGRAVWVAIIGALGVVLAAAVPLVLKSKESSKINFTGTVIQTDGKPVSMATVLSAVDRETPETVLTDSNGVFHVRIVEEAQSIRLTISAKGFAPISRDANPHRTGPELIVLAPEAKRETNQSQDQSGSTHVETHGSGSPVVIGNNNQVGH
jgi:hypothetical protein